ncbi:MAG TPA: hypothetical protein VJL84_04150 [Kiloniellales bacterium]|nr:hypothetical protein [Kiloniellales bacterium]
MPILLRGLCLLVALLAGACVSGSTAKTGLMAAVGDAAAAGRMVQLSADGRTIHFRGDVTYGTAQELLRLIKANPAVHEVHLTSNGGMVEPALLVANAIQLRRATTFVPTTCVSACTFLFLGGQQRYLAPGAALGFHRAWQSEPAFDGDVQRVNAEIRVRFAERGIDDAFVERAMATPGEQLWYPSPEELQAAGVIDGVSSAALLPR